MKKSTKKTMLAVLIAFIIMLAMPWLGVYIFITWEALVGAEVPLEAREQTVITLWILSATAFVVTAIVISTHGVLEDL